MGAVALQGCPVSGTRAGRSAARFARTIGSLDTDERQVAELRRVAYEALERKEGTEPDVVINSLQETVLSEGVFVIPNEARLKKALSDIEGIRETLLPRLTAYDPHYLALAHEAKNMVQCAELWMRCALERKESRSWEGFWREDYPQTDNVNWLKWSVIRRDGDRMALSYEPVPLEKYRHKPGQREKFTPQFFLAAERR